MSWLGAFAGGLGGAAQGARDTYPTIMASQARRKDQAQRASEATAQQKYQADRLALDTRTENRVAAQGSWRQAYDERSLAQRRREDDNRRIVEEARILRDNLRTHGDATRENYRERVRRANEVARMVNPNMSVDQMDRAARQWAFNDYGQVVGVLQTAGESMPAPGAIPTPGESGVQTIARLRAERPDLSMSDRYDGLIGTPRAEDVYDNEIRQALGR